MYYPSLRYIVAFVCHARNFKIEKQVILPIAS